MAGVSFVKGTVTDVVVIRRMDVEVTKAGVVTFAGVTVARGIATNGVVGMVSVARISVAIKSIAIESLTKSGVAGVAWALFPPSLGTSSGKRKVEKLDRKGWSKSIKSICKRLT